MEAGMKCIKYMLFMSNFMFAVIGFLLISIGSTINSIYDDFESFMAPHHFSPAAVLVAAGVIVFFVALFGCLGAIKESTLLVNLYAVLLCVVLILEISVAIAAFTARESIVKVVEENMKQSMKDYHTNKMAKSTWDFAQLRLMCCGVHNMTDWYPYMSRQTGFLEKTKLPVDEMSMVPYSCCVQEDCTQIYNDGCFDRLSYIVRECSFMLGSGAMCVALVQTLGIVFAHMLAKSIRRAKTKREMQKEFQREQFYKQLATRGEDNFATLTYATKQHIIN